MRYFELFVSPIRIQKYTEVIKMAKKVVDPKLQRKKKIADCWEKFLKKHPDEKTCSIFAVKMHFKDLVVSCPQCGFANKCTEPENRSLKCAKCKKKIWILSGTFFRKVRRFQPWMAAIWFIERGVEITAAELARLVSVATSTVLAIFKKLSVVVESQMGKEIDLIASAKFVKSFMRRSRETPGGKHPREEETAAFSQRGNKSDSALHAQQIHRANRAPRPALTQEELDLANKLIGETEKYILSLLSLTPIRFDELHLQTELSIENLSAALMNLELFELLERLPGDQFILGVRADLSLTQSPQVQASNSQKDKVVSRFLDFVRSNHGGLSRKYLQCYVSLLWAFTDKVRWKKGSLIKACVAFREVTDDELIAYVTPLKVATPIALAA